MIRIDDERWGEGEFVVNSLPLEITMERSDAWDRKTGAHASTLEIELMHEAEKQGAMHHFSSEPGPAEPQTRLGGAPTPPQPRPIKKAGGCRLTLVP